MNKFKLIITLSAAILMCGSAFAQKKKELSPKKFFATVELKGKKPYVYYPLSEKARNEFRVDGPGVFQVNVRVRVTENRFASEPLKIKVVSNTGSVQYVDVPALKAGNLKVKGFPNDAASQKYTFTLDVPPGKNTYKIYKKGTGEKVYVRVFYQSHPKPKWKDMEGNTAKMCTVVHEKTGKSRKYYVVNQKQGFQFSCSDSTRLRIVARPMFSYKMLSDVKYKLVLLNTSSGEETVYTLNATRSSVFDFKEHPKMVPGKSNIFYLNLPASKKGKDDYMLLVKSGVKQVAVRLSVDENL